MKSYPLVSGNELPGIGLGTWQADPGVVGAAVKAAIEVGYRHIDCAQIYGNEVEIGQALSSLFEAGTVKREDLFITSKLWCTMHNPEDVKSALVGTLKDLGLDYLDLYLIHWPVHIRNNHKDADGESRFIAYEDIPIAKTWLALEECVDQGLVKDIGVSNYSVKKLKEIVSFARIPPAVNQVERHPYLQNPELIGYCQQNGIHLTAYSPLGSSATPFRNKSVPGILKDETIAKIASKHDVTPAQVLIQWELACGCSALPKSTKRERIIENFEAAGTKFTLTDEDMADIATIDKHSRYIDGAFWCGENSPYTLENIWNEGDVSSGK